MGSLPTSWPPTALGCGGKEAPACTPSTMGCLRVTLASPARRGDTGAAQPPARQTDTCPCSGGGRAAAVPRPWCDRVSRCNFMACGCREDKACCAPGRENSQRSCGRAPCTDPSRQQLPRWAVLGKGAGEDLISHAARVAMEQKVRVLQRPLQSAGTWSCRSVCLSVCLSASSPAPLPVRSQPSQPPFSLSFSLLHLQSVPVASSPASRVTYLHTEPQFLPFLSRTMRGPCCHAACSEHNASGSGEPVPEPVPLSPSPRWCVRSLLPAGRAVPSLRPAPCTEPPALPLARGAGNARRQHGQRGSTARGAQAEAPPSCARGQPAAPPAVLALCPCQPGPSRTETLQGPGQGCPPSEVPAAGLSTGSCHTEFGVRTEVGEAGEVSAGEVMLFRAGRRIRLGSGGHGGRAAGRGSATRAVSLPRIEVAAADSAPC